MLTDLKVSLLARKYVFYRPERIGKERYHGKMKCKNEIYQRIEFKEKMKKMASFV